MAFETPEFPHRVFENLAELSNVRREQSRLAAELKAKRQGVASVKAESNVESSTSEK